MIAELHNKISKTMSNLDDRREDELTGNVFGTLRYIPFSKGMKRILTKCIYPPQLSQYFENIDIENWADCISFWPQNDRVELDAQIDFEAITIGIEVKFKSGLSSDDDVGIESQQKDILSKNQLSKESRVLSKTKTNNKILIFIAETDDCLKVYQNVYQRDIIDHDVAFGYISWQSILRELKNLHDLNEYEQVIINDLIHLLQKKGFETFHNFHIQQEINSYFWDFGFNFIFEPEISTTTWSFGFDFNIDQEISTEIWEYGFSFLSLQKINKENYYEFTGKY